MRIQFTKALAERAQIWLTTSTFDGKQVPLTRFHYVIPVADYQADESTPKPSQKTATESAPAALPATERREQ